MKALAMLFVFSGMAFAGNVNSIDLRRRPGGSPHSAYAEKMSSLYPAFWNT